MIRNTRKRHGNRLINLRGRIFGHLLVKRVDVTKSSKITGEHMANAYWLCLCDLCGCIVSVRSSYLRNGQTRMCGDCASEARIRFFLKMKELDRKIWEIDEPTTSKSMKKFKKIKVPPGTTSRKIVMYPTFRGQNAIKQCRPLRDTGMPIIDIAELLQLTEKQVREELNKTK